MKQTTKISVDKFLRTSELSDFLDAARSYCSFIETNKTENPKEFLLSVQQYLLSLYSNVTKLPIIDSKYDSINQFDFYDTENKDIISLINDRIDYPYYWHNFDPTDEDEMENVGGDLVDDLENIYNDIKRALLLFDSDTIEAKGNAIWQFKFDFDQHWGNHCADSLYAIHYFIKGDRYKYGW